MELWITFSENNYVYQNIKHITWKKNNSIVRINLIDYAVPQIAKANLGGTEEQLMVRV